MKIRNGFVSNSSSSSYIVKIRSTYWDEFCDILISDKGFCFKDELVKEIEEEIARWEKYAEDDAKQESKLPTLASMHTDRLKELREWKEELEPEKVDADTLIKIALKFNGIQNRVTNEDVVELTYITSMHNSFNEGMGDLFKEIVLLFMFDTKKRLECERESYE